MNPKLLETTKETGLQFFVSLPKEYVNYQTHNHSHDVVSFH